MCSTGSCTSTDRCADTLEYIASRQCIFVDDSFGVYLALPSLLPICMHILVTSWSHQSHGQSMEQGPFCSAVVAHMTSVEASTLVGLGKRDSS